MAEEFPHYIEFRHVYKTFDKPVLVDSNFHVDSGQTVAIIGRSGVGKSGWPDPRWTTSTPSDPSSRTRRERAKVADSEIASTR